MEKEPCLQKMGHQYWLDRTQFSAMGWNWMEQDGAVSPSRRVRAFGVLFAIFGFSSFLFLKVLQVLAIFIHTTVCFERKRRDETRRTRWGKTKKKKKKKCHHHSSVSRYGREGHLRSWPAGMYGISSLLLARLPEKYLPPTYPPTTYQQYKRPVHQVS
ncbi:hypothetical protein IWZ03DRAFT_64352 [Phyllosticta citriasiana]|uniref:Uncharacterized protein n=1 Tax=Phyllosticta citriasiana TaxID=595635 RepID=A0ABR1KBM3_9PEZI